LFVEKIGEIRVRLIRAAASCANRSFLTKSVHTSGENEICFKEYVRKRIYHLFKNNQFPVKRDNWRTVPVTGSQGVNVFVNFICTNRED